VHDYLTVLDHTESWW